jgi:hypothetical protein
MFGAAWLWCVQEPGSGSGMNDCTACACMQLHPRNHSSLYQIHAAAAAAAAAGRYCCKACQVEHWKWHKALCKELSKPAAAAAAAAASAVEAATAAAAVPS